MIIWKEDERKGELWDRHKLYLHCTFETRCLTAEGTSSIVQEKQKEVTKVIDLMKAKEELSDTQQAFIRRKNSTLAKLNNTFPRPSKPVYQGKPNVYLGIAMGLEQPVTIAIVDIETNQVITYRNTKQLLGEDYPLLRRRRTEKQKLSEPSKP